MLIFSHTTEGEGKFESKKKIPQNHKEQEELRIQRKVSANPSFSLITDLKKLWEEGRTKQASVDRRKVIVKEMLALTIGNLREVVFQHDGARLVQFCLQYGDSAQRDSLFKALLGSRNLPCINTILHLFL